MIYFKRIFNKTELNETNYDLIEALIKEVDPNWVLDFSGFDYVFGSNDFWWLEIYDDKQCTKQIGFVAFNITRDVFSVYKRAGLYHLYLLPEYRGLRGGRVIKAVEKIAKDQGATDFTWSAHTGSALEKCFREKHGYKKIECCYQKTFIKV